MAYEKKEMSPEMSDMAPEVVQGTEAVAVAEDEMVGEFQPRGNFKKKPLNTLVMMTSKMQPLYGLKGDYPKFDEDQTELPIEFVRLLMMFKQSVDDAIVADVVDEDKSFTMEEITDDSSVKILAGKLGTVVRDKKFKKFLSESAPADEGMEEEIVEEPSLDEERTPMPEGADETIDELFMGRM
jgi:hypothetical protein|tara:strand:+ start:4077 stop:4625 length:549 start_codon:yes stop_codon:yes gene_type:complete